MFRRRRDEVPLAQTLHRAEAVIGVLNEDLHRVAPLLHPPRDAGGTASSDAERARARTELQAAEGELRQLEELADIASDEARRWQARAALATEEGREDLAAQARGRVGEALRTVDSYAAEIHEARALVDEWSAYLGR